MSFMSPEAKQQIANACKSIIIRQLRSRFKEENIEIVEHEISFQRGVTIYIDGYILAKIAGKFSVQLEYTTAIGFINDGYVEITSIEKLY